MVWKSNVSYRQYGPNVYVDKMKELVESLLADEHYNQCNSDFARHFLINGCGRWLFLEVNSYSSIHWGHGCWLLVGVERWWEIYKVLVKC